MPVQNVQVNADVIRIDRRRSDEITKKSGPVLRLFGRVGIINPDV